MNRSLFLQTAKLTTPIFFGYIAIGIPFGLMVTAAHYPWWLALIMSITMYAGAGQYAAIALFSSGASLYTIAITILVVNIRHIVYGLSLIDKFKNTGKWKPYLIFGLTDETYALLTSCTVPTGCEKGEWYGTITMLNQSYWVLGTLIGSVAGILIPFSFQGVDFALTALFIVLLIDQIKTTKNPLPPIIGLIVAIIAMIFVKSSQMLITSLAIGMVVLSLLKNPVESLQQKHEVTNE